MKIVDVLYEAHINGECSDECAYCLFEDELNEDYNQEERKMNKKAWISKSEKAIRKI